jgi:hypothetical protein
MKKIYLRPTTDMMVVELQNMIALSPLNTDGANHLSSTGAESDAMSRDYDDWDE